VPMISPQRSACDRAAPTGDPRGTQRSWVGGDPDRPRAMSRDGRQLKERSMRKGFFASVAALAAGAGVALGQGYPTGPAAGDPMRGAPPGYPTGRPVNGYPTAGMSPAYPAGPPAYPAGAEPPA